MSFDRFFRADVLIAFVALESSISNGIGILHPRRREIIVSFSAWGKKAILLVLSIFWTQNFQRPTLTHNCHLTFIGHSIHVNFPHLLLHQQLKIGILFIDVNVVFFLRGMKMVDAKFKGFFMKTCFIFKKRKTKRSSSSINLPSDVWRGVSFRFCWHSKRHKPNREPYPTSGLSEPPTNDDDRGQSVKYERVRKNSTETKCFLPCISEGSPRPFLPGKWLDKNPSVPWSEFSRSEISNPFLTSSYRKCGNSKSSPRWPLEPSWTGIWKCVMQRCSYFLSYSLVPHLRLFNWLRIFHELTMILHYLLIIDVFNLYVTLMCEYKPYDYKYERPKTNNLGGHKICAVSLCGIFRDF